MHRILILAALAVGVCASFSLGQPAKQKSSKAPVKQKAAVKTKAKATKGAPAKAASRRSNQQFPTSERYKEIQQALAGKGFFNGPIDGNWGASSIEGLKLFQRNQNISEDGKLGALSLIALGLGPKRTQVH